LAHLRNAVPVS